MDFTFPAIKLTCESTKFEVLKAIKFSIQVSWEHFACVVGSGTTDQLTGRHILPNLKPLNKFLVIILSFVVANVRRCYVAMFP